MGAFGFTDVSNVAYNFLGGVSANDFGVIATPGAKVVYVCNALPSNMYDQSITSRTVSTLSSALSQCRSGFVDTVVVLPGHSENVTDATMLNNLVAGTRIVGIGDPSQDNAPTFRWTATASQWAVSVKNVVIQNLRLRMEGANGVVKALNVTGSGFKMVGCNVQVASGASNKATIAIEIGSGATECQIVGNRFRGTETHNVTDLIKVVGATTPDDLFIAENDILASATAANGLIHVTVAAKRVHLLRNRLYNTHTSSTAAIAVDNVAADGVIEENYVYVMNDGTAASQGIVFAGTATMKCSQNFCTDEPRKSGVLAPAAVAT